MVGRYYFAIVSNEDESLFDFEYSGKVTESKEHRHLNQFIVHAALDIIDEQQWTSNSTFLKSVDRFNDWYVSAYIVPGRLRFVLLHDEPNESKIRNFFTEVYETYVKIALNPFFDHSKPIRSPSFVTRIQRLSTKHFG